MSATPKFKRGDIVVHRLAPDVKMLITSVHVPDEPPKPCPKPCEHCSREYDRRRYAKPKDEPIEYVCRTPAHGKSKETNFMRERFNEDELQKATA